MSGFLQKDGERFAVASGCRHATSIASDVMAQGGTVFDAALAGSAALCVTLPHSVSIGGDLFALLQTPGTGPVSLSATGAAPRRATVAEYRSRGHSAVPVRGALSIQIPGLAAGWEAMASRWASWPLARLLEPAIALASKGFPAGARLARLSQELDAECSRHPGWRAAYVPDGRHIPEGGLLRQPRLAAALERLAQHGARGFYEGPVADDIVASVGRAGGLIDHADLASVAATIGPALKVRIGGAEIATQPPISQGVVLLCALRRFHARMAEAGNPAERLWSDAARALRSAFAERTRLLGDRPDSFELAQRMIDGRLQGSGGSSALASDGSETTTIAVIDADGNAASLILSIFADFGSGIVTDETGILLNNRLSGFFLDEAHPNGLMPGKRAMHTLHSVIVNGEAGTLMAGASPGGHAQPQVNLQVLSRALFDGDPLSRAAAAPRWMLIPDPPAGQGDRSAPEIQCEPDLPPDVIAQFGEAGFRTRRMGRADIGSAKWVARAPDRRLLAVCDTRRDAAVEAW